MEIYLNLLGVLIEQKKNENGKTKIDFLPDAKEMYLKIKSLAEKNDCVLHISCSEKNITKEIKDFCKTEFQIDENHIHRITHCTANTLSVLIDSNEDEIFQWRANNGIGIFHESPAQTIKCIERIFKAIDFGCKTEAEYIKEDFKNPDEILQDRQLLRMTRTDRLNFIKSMNGGHWTTGRFIQSREGKFIQKYRVLTVLEEYKNKFSSENNLEKRRYYIEEISKKNDSIKEKFEKVFELADAINKNHQDMDLNLLNQFHQIWFNEELMDEKYWNYLLDKFRGFYNFSDYSKLWLAFFAFYRFAMKYPSKSNFYFAYSIISILTWNLPPITFSECEWERANKAAYHIDRSETFTDVRHYLMELYIEKLEEKI